MNTRSKPLRIGWNWSPMLAGQHEFKICRRRLVGCGAPGPGNYDAPPGASPPGGNLQHRFSGTHRLVLTMTEDKSPRLQIEPCAAPPAGESVLFLRGGMNNWASLDDYAFTFHCDAYYLNEPEMARIQDRRCGLTAAATWGERAALSWWCASARPGWHPERMETSAISWWTDGEHTLRLSLSPGTPACPSA